MDPDERRAAILDAVVPLLRTPGASLSTRSIAEAAGIAEGTIFRVFADKAELLMAAVRRALEPDALLDELRAVEQAPELRTYMVRLVDVMSAQAAGIRSVLVAVHFVGGNDGPHRPGSHGFDVRRRYVDGLGELLTPYREQLRGDPAVCGRILAAVVFSTNQLAFMDGDSLTTDQLVEVVLDGMLARNAPTTPSEGIAC